MMKWSMVSRFAETVWGKVLIALTMVSLGGGVVAAIVEARSTYSAASISSYRAEYAGVSKKAEADGKKFAAAESEQRALNAQLQSSSEAEEADYKAEVERQKALNASIRARAESELKRAEAEVEAAKSEYRKRQLDGEAETVEAETRQLMVGIKILEDRLNACGYCKGRESGCYSKCSFNNSMSSILGR